MDPLQAPAVTSPVDPLQNPAAMNPYAALMYRKAQLQAQEQAAMQASQGAVTGGGLPPPPLGQQAQFSGYGAQPTAQLVNGRPVTPQQMQRIAAMLQNRR